MTPWNRRWFTESKIRTTVMMSTLTISNIIVTNIDASQIPAWLKNYSGVYIILLMVCVVVAFGLYFKQRRDILRRFDRNENFCLTCCILYCCLPCSFGQLGLASVENKAVLRTLPAETEAVWTLQKVFDEHIKLPFWSNTAINISVFL